MKNMKKFFALLLAMAMVMGMATSVFAEPADLTGHTFKAYQIFTASSISEDGELGNLAWGDGISTEGQAAILAKYDVKTLEELVEVLGGMEDDKTATTTTVSEAKEFGQLVSGYTVEGKGRTVESGTTTLPIGYYLIVDETTGKVDAYNLSVLKVSDNTTPVVIINKSDVPSVDKVILDPTAMEANEAGIGEAVNYKITGTLPTNFADYEEYFYWFKDDLSKGLTYNNDAKVYVVNGESKVEVTEYFYIKASDYSDRTGTHIDIKIADLVCLNKLEGVTVDAKTQIVVEYSATVNDNAVIAPSGNPNKVKLEYSNNPDKNGDGKDKPEKPGDKEPTTDHPTGETPEDDVITYVTEVTINKIDGATGEALEGAEFTLIGTNTTKVIIKTGEDFVADAQGTYYKLADGTFTTEAPKADQYDGETLIFENNYADYDTEALEAGTMYKKVTISTTYKETKDDEGKVTTTTIKATTGEDGKITFTGLTMGEYTLVESVTPAGYNTIDDIDFVINWSENDGFTVSSEDATFSGNQTFSVTIENNKGTTLPETGGMGTRLFYMIGGLLVVAAGVLLITKRRMATK